MTLRYGTYVVVGRCKKCQFVIWGPEGTKKTEHSYCGVVRK